MAPKTPAKAAHTNMMTDCIIANLPPEILRSVMRELLGGNLTITANFQSLVSNHLTNTRPEAFPELFTSGSDSPKPLPTLNEIQRRYRCLMGVGRGFESIEALNELLVQVGRSKWSRGTTAGHDFVELLAVIDGDVVQAVTAVQKQLLTSSGVRAMTSPCSENHLNSSRRERNKMAAISHFSEGWLASSH
jgi:hypothetical protein